jgi:hypothetical protein
MKILTLLIAFIVATSVTTFTQPSIEWQRCLGGSGADSPRSLCISSENGYAIAGSTASINGDIIGYYGNESSDAWVVKIDILGGIQWQRCIGGTGNDQAYCIKETKDKGYIVIGTTSSNDFDVKNYHNRQDYLVAKLSMTGTLEWCYAYGGSGDDVANSVVQTGDGGYLVAGSSNSNDGDIDSSRLNNDFWLIKLNAEGKKLWSKNYGGGFQDVANKIIASADGGCLIVGYSASSNGDLKGKPLQDYDCWIIKINSEGVLLWEKNYGGLFYESANDAVQLPDGGYVVVGYTSSKDSIFNSNHGGNDFLVFRIDSVGNQVWIKCFGGTSNDNATAIDIDYDGSFIVCGHTRSNNLQVDGNRGPSDAWLIKVSSNGNLIWRRCLGGTMQDLGYDVKVCGKDQYLIAIESQSVDGDVKGNHSIATDFWIVKLKLISNSVQENTLNDYKIFFDNSTSQINISSEKSIERICLYNVLGQCLVSTDLISNNSVHIDAANYNTGLYFVVFIDENSKQRHAISFVKN